MFMIPIPATSNEKAAATTRISFFLQFMVVAQYLCQLLDGGIRQFLGDSRADDARKPRLGGNTLHHRRIGRNDDVVLIHTPRIVTLRLQHTNDTHRNGLKADGLADGVSTAEEFLDYCGSDNTHLGGLLDVLFCEALPFIDCPLTDIEIIYRLTVHRRSSIVITIDGLPRGSNLRRHLCHEALLTQDALVVGYLQRLHGRRVLTDTATHIGTRSDGEQVGAHRGQLLTDALLRALSY